MKISNVYSAYDVYRVDVDKSAASTKTTRAGGKKDAVALSSQAKDFQTVASALANAPDVREDRVNQLKAKIDANQYNIKPEDIARRIIDTALYI